MGKMKEFFKMSMAKIGIAIILLLATLTLAFAFMDVISPTGLQYIGMTLAKILALGVLATNWIIYRFFSQIDGSQLALGGSLSWIPLVVNLIWDYVLACVVVWIFNKIKSKKQMPLWLKGGLWGLFVWAIVTWSVSFSMLGINLIPFDISFLLNNPLVYLLVSLVIYFLIGALIGFIVQKIKNKKRGNKK